MGIIQTSAGKVWASTVVPCKWELSWTISFLDKRLRQQSKLLGGFKSGRVWKLATNLNPTMGWTPIRKWPSAHNIFGWVETTSCCLNPKTKSSGNPQFSSQKSPAKIPSKSLQAHVNPNLQWWSPQHLNSTRLCEWPVSMKVPGWWCIASSWHSLTKTETRLFHMGIGWIGW